MGRGGWGCGEWCPRARRWVAGCLLAGSVWGASAPAPAQSPAADSAKAALEPLFVPTDALYAAGFAIGTLALYPVDVSFAEAARHPARQASELLGTGSTTFATLGFPGTFVAAGGMYLFGRATDRPGLADVGLHTGEALAMAVAITGVLKVVAGRARPNEQPDDPYRFGFGRGLQGDRYQAFPSGHTSSAFAAAAALATEIGRLHPEARGWVRPLLYGSAALVGLSRTYDNEHWASDVVAGAAIGTFSGWKVVRYNHTHPRNPLDRVFLAAHLTPLPPGGFAATWSF